jgi:hypothetical protein
MRGKLIAVVCLIAAPLMLVATAAADQSFHTSHADVHPISDAPLRSGFVNDIHTQGVTIGAQELYQLNGAAPGTTYTVALWIYARGSGSCAGTPLRILPTETFTTNAAGNGEAGHTFLANPNAPPPNPVPTPIKWVFSTGGAAVYETDCVLVFSG